jgi:uncharacterized protein DUF262
VPAVSVFSASPQASPRRITTRNIAWFHDHFARGSLNLDPPYQRRSVWNQAFRDYFIDTLLLGYPAPAVFLYEEITADGIATYHVVDGKQRLTTIFDFVADGFPVAENAVHQQARGSLFSELSEDARKALWAYEFCVEYVFTTDEEVITNIFDRLNRNVARLTRQELRHAKYSGAFITAAESLTEWMVRQLPSEVPRLTPGARSQMKDVELVAQLLLLLETGPRSFSQNDLDDVTSDRDDDWAAKGDVTARFRSVVSAMGEICDGWEALSQWGHRLRNQADFYSFFGAIANLQSSGRALPASHLVQKRVDGFFETVNDEVRRKSNMSATEYYEAVRANSNGATERRLRIELMERVITRARS